LKLKSNIECSLRGYNRLSRRHQRIDILLSSAWPTCLVLVE
jgi:hypothetical protein